jgi:cell division septation protein DedD
MRNEDRIKEKESEARTVAAGALRGWIGGLLAFALGMFIAGFFVGKEYSTFVTKQFTTDEARDKAVAGEPRIEDEFLKRYMPPLRTGGQEDLTRTDPKLAAMIDRAKAEGEKLDAIPPKPTAPPPEPEAPAEIAKTGLEAPPSTFEKPTFTLQLTAVKSQSSAEEELAKLKQKGYETAYILHAEPWYRIRVGRFATREQMETFRDYYMKTEKQTLFPAYVDQ